MPREKNSSFYNPKKLFLVALTWITLSLKGPFQKTKLIMRARTLSLLVMWVERNKMSNFFQHVDDISGKMRHQFWDPTLEILLFNFSAMTVLIGDFSVSGYSSRWVNQTHLDDRIFFVIRSGENWVKVSFFRNFDLFRNGVIV